MLLLKASLARRNRILEKEAASCMNNVEAGRRASRERAEQYSREYGDDKIGRRTYHGRPNNIKRS